MMKAPCIILLAALFTSQPVTAASVRKDVQQAVSRFKAKDPALKRFFDEAAGYAVFPNVGKGGLFIGAAHGTGQVFEKGRVIGTAELFQGSIGFQVGGQEFSEIIFFKTTETLKSFKLGQFALSAGASAIVAAEGAGAKAKYNLDVAVFVLPKAGAMLEAAVGGQKFEFKSD